MPVPARRHSKTRTRSRRAHDFLKSVNDVTCSNCQAPCLSHIACTTCGFYKGRQVVDVTRAKERLTKRIQKKAFERSKAVEDASHDHDHDHAEEEKPKKTKAKKTENKSE